MLRVARKYLMKPKHCFVPSSAVLALLFLACAATLQGADKNELVRRGFFGARTTAVEGGTGAQVKEILPASFAAIVGLEATDVITSLNGVRVASPAVLPGMLRSLRSGAKVRLEYRRKGSPISTNAEGTMPEQPRETNSSAEVLYDSVKGPNNQRLRTIITKPRSLQGKVPVIFVAGWLSDDSVEAPNGTKDGTALVLRELAELPGLATLRLDKPGTGDSDGDCARTDFDAELAGYRAAFAAISRHDFIDANRIFIVGISNGGGFAPIVPPTPEDAARVRGYVTVGGWTKTWFEHMIEIERRRLTLSGKSPTEVNNGMKALSGLYHDMLVKSEKVESMLQSRPELAKLWPGDDSQHLYGRPIAFYQQLQRLNLAEAWSKVAVPTLILWGQYDWIMSREDQDLIAAYVNANRAGAAEFVELPHTGHTFQNYRTMADAFRGDEQSFDSEISQRLIAWFEQRRNN